MSKRSAIVLVIDRLSAGFLGPYGNTWLETSQWNRLASMSTLVEFHTADAVDQRRLYRSYWSGTHAASPDAPAARSLGRRFHSAGLPTRLVTDDSDLAAHPLGQDFAEIELLPDFPVEGPAAEVEDTGFARFALAAGEAIQQLEPGQLLWLHSCGLSGPWDAPQEMRQQLADDEDPDPRSFIEPPAGEFSGEVDPDELLGLSQAYGAQVLVIDQWLGFILDVLTHVTLPDETLLCVTSARGYPLGEHHVVGAAAERLFSESLATPLLIRRPDETGSGERFQQLTQPTDLYATLLDWFGVPNGAVQSRSLLQLGQTFPLPWREQVCSFAADERSIRTPSWFLRAGAAGAELYVKPDDRWEVNDVADRCPQIAEALLAALDEYDRLAQADQLAELSPLAEELLEGLP